MRAGTKWGLALLGVAPHLYLYLYHFAVLRDSATGFLFADMPYYAANAREIFEAGNGLLYPNPFALDSQRPAIYFQLLPWLLGIGIRIVHLDPGYLFAGVGILAALCLGRITLALAEERIGQRHLVPAYLLLMWGGGVLVFRAMLAGSEDLLAYDPQGGWWLPFWGRSAIFTTEAIYHALVAVVIFGVFRKNGRFIALGSVALALTHPWTSVEVLSAVLLYFVVARFTSGVVIPKVTLAIVVAALMFVLVYYGLILPQFESHREIVQHWSELDWTHPFNSLFYSLLPPLSLAMAYLLKRPRLQHQEVFLIVFFAVCFVLTKHEWFMAPVQPIHFNRGYPLVALALLGLPVLDRLKARGSTVTIGAIVLLLSVDNLYFVYAKTHGKHDDQVVAHYLTPDERSMFTSVDERELEGIFVAQDVRMRYLATVYTSLTGYAAYWHLSNDHFAKLKSIERLYSGDTVSLAHPKVYYHVRAGQQIAVAGDTVYADDSLTLIDSRPTRR